MEEKFEERRNKRAETYFATMRIKTIIAIAVVFVFAVVFIFEDVVVKCLAANIVVTITTLVVRLQKIDWQIRKKTIFFFTIGSTLLAFAASYVMDISVVDKIWLVGICFMPIIALFIRRIYSSRYLHAVIIIIPLVFLLFVFGYYYRNLRTSDNILPEYTSSAKDNKSIETKSEESIQNTTEYETAEETQIETEIESESETETIIETEIQTESETVVETEVETLVREEETSIEKSTEELQYSLVGDIKYSIIGDTLEIIAPKEYILSEYYDLYIVRVGVQIQNQKVEENSDCNIISFTFKEHGTIIFLEGMFTTVNGKSSERVEINI